MRMQTTRIAVALAVASALAVLVAASTQACPIGVQGVADPGCTVCAEELATGKLWCTQADANGSFYLTGDPDQVPQCLPTGGEFWFHCVDCHDDGQSVDRDDPSQQFGGDWLDVRCESTCTETVTLTAGRCDRFAGCEDGDGPEKATPDVGLYSFMLSKWPTPPLDFDEEPGVGGIAPNSAFGHTLTGLPGGIVSATLEITVAGTSGAGGSQASTDSIGLEYTGQPTTFAWTGRFDDIQSYPTGGLQVYILPLDALPPLGGVTTDLVTGGYLADGRLDVYVQDDTQVDCIKLHVTHRCGAPPPRDLPHGQLVRRVARRPVGDP